MSVTVQYGTPCKWNLRLTTTLPGEITWWRGITHPDGATSNTQLPGTGNPYTDTTAPLVGTVTYTAVAATGSESAAPFVVAPPAAPVLSDPLDPAGPFAVAAIQQQTEHVWQGATTVYEVIDRLNPLVNPCVPNNRTGSMTLLAPHDGAAFPADPLKSIRDLLYTGKVLLIRTLCRTRAESLSFVVTGWTEAPMAAVAGADRRFTIDYRVADPRGEAVRAVYRLWRDVAAQYPTWQAVANDNATWAEVAYG